MQPILEDEPTIDGAGIAKRKLLIPVDDSPESEKALAWAMREIYREGDEIHLVHVVPKLQMGICYGAPPVDFLPQQDPIAYDQLVTQAESFIQMRFLPSLHNLRVHPIVHIVKAEVDTESIGTVLCRKAESLDAAAIIVSCEARSKLQEFFLGSITNFCTHHSKRPVLVVK